MPITSLAAVRRGNASQDLPRDERGWRVDPAPDGRGMPEAGEARRPRPRPRFIAVILVLLAVNYALVALLGPSTPGQTRVPYAPFFIDQVNAGHVQDISSQGSTIQGTFRTPVRFPPDDAKAPQTTRFKTEVPTFADNVTLSRLLAAKRVQVNAEPVSTGGSLLGNLLLGFGPTLLLVGVFVLIARRSAAGGPGGLMGFMKSKARRVDGTEQRICFADIAGIEDAKAELSEVVDFLKNPERYGRLGGRVPHGVLLSGAPGTGKTLLARAVAGEAHAAFFSISASEFVEAIVGVGAARVRDLFTKAKAAMPAIIFIDELDAIGRSRSSGLQLGSNDEREQTLNQILTEMDGFASSAAVIVLAATNRPEVLDSALLRPGRFDRRVAVQAPDAVGRAAILAVHTRSIPLAPEVDLERLAATTPGMVGADLANLVNEAALLAARRDHHQVEPADFTDALEKILLGAPRGLVLSERDRRRTAYHEAGHALVGMLTPGADPVRKISIIPRGLALGVTLSSPDTDRVSYEQGELLAAIKVALGGRAAEEEVYQAITTGAQSDIQHLTAIARQMVGSWGMSPAIGPIAIDAAPPAGMFLPGASPSSSDTERLADAEVRRIVDGAHAEVRVLLGEHRHQLDTLANALLAAETLDQDAAYRAAGLAQPLLDPAPEGIPALAAPTANGGAGAALVTPAAPVV